MTLRAKLLVAQIPLWLTLLLVGMGALFTTASLGRRAQSIMDDNYSSVQAVREMTESLERLNGDAQAVLHGRAPQAEEEAVRHRARFEANLRRQEQSAVEIGEPEATKELRRLWDDYKTSFQVFLDTTQPHLAREVYQDRLQPAFRQVKRAEEHIVAINQAAMERKSEMARQGALDFQKAMATVSLAALAGGLLVTLVITSRLLRPLSVLGQALQRIGGGDFEARVSLSGRDEITSLAGEINDMVGRLRVYRQSSLGELLLAQQASQATLNSLPDPVMVFSLEGRLVNLNQAAEALLHRLQATGDDPFQSLDPALAQRAQQMVGHVLEGRGALVPKGFEDALRLSTPAGDRYLLPRATPVYEPGGGLTGVTLVCHDVTRLRRFDQMKNDLVATVAHEFRTPLTSLRMAIYLCLEGAAGPLSPKQADLLDAARQDCERVQAMVDDILDMSRMGEGGEQLRRRAVPAGELLAHARQAHAAAAQERGVELVGPEVILADQVLADPERVALVYSNLVVNALRHTPAGGRVTLAAGPLGGAVLFEVADSG